MFLLLLLSITYFYENINNFFLLKYTYLQLKDKYCYNDDYAVIIVISQPAD
jgi:hypothetical protein